MTQFARKSFSVAMVVAGGGEMCKAKGHSALDAKGKCVCCGWRPDAFDPRPLTQCDVCGISRVSTSDTLTDDSCSRCGVGRFRLQAEPVRE